MTGSTHDLGHGDVVSAERRFIPQQMVKVVHRRAGLVQMGMTLMSSRYEVVDVELLDGENSAVRLQLRQGFVPETGSDVRRDSEEYKNELGSQLLVLGTRLILTEAPEGMMQQTQ